jgi:hypothetical protein
LLVDVETQAYIVSLGPPGLEEDETLFDLMTLKPDVVQATIDETDISLDFLRYRRIA